MLLLSSYSVSLCACVLVCVRARACVRACACVHACMYARARACVSDTNTSVVLRRCSGILRNGGAVKNLLLSLLYIYPLQNVKGEHLQVPVEMAGSCPGGGNCHIECLPQQPVSCDRDLGQECQVCVSLLRGLRRGHDYHRHHTAQRTTPS